MPKTLRVPSYRRHKPSDQAVVTLNGRDFYLGKWNTKASRAEYSRMIGEWLAGGSCVQQSDITVAELCAAYWKMAKDYYRVRPGGSHGQVDRVRLAIRCLKDYGHTLAKDFRPLALQAIQRRLVDADNSRTYINSLVDVIKRIFKWAVHQELVGVTVYQTIALVPGLRKGRCGARESDPVRPVGDAIVETTIRYLPPVVAAMVRLQRLTGCRPGEVCLIRPADVDTSNEIWRYKPMFHKTEHHGRDRVIFLGPQAQDILRPFLLRASGDFCFTPSESERRRNALRREARRTPMTPSQSRRRPKRRCTRAPGDRYDTAGYRRAISRGVARANRELAKQAVEDGQEPMVLPPWHPNQLRHTAATEIRRQFGLEAAQVALGHSKADVTQVYAERNYDLASVVMKRIG